MPSTFARFVLAAALVGVGASPARAATALPEIAKPLHAEVSVDTAGHVTRVAVVENVAPSIQQAVEARLRDLRFEPARAGGTPVPASTFVEVDVCAFPDGPAYRTSVNVGPNGPLLLREGAFEFQHALRLYGGQHLYAVIKLRAKPDGHAELLDVQYVDVAPAVQNEIRIMARSWVWSLRFTPEQVGGQPVATEIEWPVEWFRMQGPPVPSMRRLPPPRAGNDRACRVPTRPNDIPQRIDSPLKMLDAPAASSDGTAP